MEGLKINCTGYVTNQVCILHTLLSRDYKIKNTAFARYRLHPYFTVVQLYNFFAMSKTNAGAFIFGSGVQALKNYKYPFAAGFTNANPVIGKSKMPVAFGFGSRNYYLRSGIFFSEVNGLKPFHFFELLPLYDQVFERFKTLAYLQKNNLWHGFGNLAAGANKFNI